MPLWQLYRNGPFMNTCIILPILFFHCELVMYRKSLRTITVFFDVKYKLLVVYVYWIKGKGGQYVICCVCKPQLLQKIYNIIEKLIIVFVQTNGSRSNESAAGNCLQAFCSAEPSINYSLSAAALAGASSHTKASIRRDLRSPFVPCSSSYLIYCSDCEC